MKQEERRMQAGRRANQNNEPNITEEQSCIYDVVLCGGLRKCMFLKYHNNSDQLQRKAKLIGLTIITGLTLVAATVMELCHL